MHLLGYTSSQWAAGGTVATAVVAVVAALFAGWQVLEVRRTRAEQARPFVIVDIQSSPVWQNLLNLVIENIGTTVAQDVRIRFDPPLKSSKAEIKLEEAVLLTEGIPMLPPGRRIQAFFDASHERKATDLPMRYDVEVRLRDFRGRDQAVQRYVIDLAPLYGWTSITEYGVHHAAKALQEIQQSMKRWSDATGRLRIWTRNEDRYRLDEVIEHDLTGHYPTLGSKSPPEILVVAGRNVLVRSFYRWLARRRADATESST